MNIYFNGQAPLHLNMMIVQVEFSTFYYSVCLDVLLCASVSQLTLQLKYISLIIVYIFFFWNEIFMAIKSFV